MNPSHDPNPTTSSGAPSFAEKARETARTVKTAAADATHRATEEAARFADERKGSVAQRFDRYGNALHRSAESLENDDPNIAWVAHRAAERVEGVAQYLRTHDFSALRRDAEDLARRHPGLFLGGLFVGGLVLGNVLKSAGRAAASSAGADHPVDEAEASAGMGGPEGAAPYASSAAYGADAPGAPAYAGTSAYRTGASATAGAGVGTAASEI